MYEKNKPAVPTHQSPQQQKDDYNKISTGQHTAVKPTHRGQTPINKGYKPARSK